MVVNTTDNEETNHDSDATFEDALISRRQFVHLSAATAGVLALPGAATANLSSPQLTDKYQYVVNHINTDEQIPTLATFEDAAGVAAFADRISNTRTTTTPQPAAHGYLTPGDVEEILSIDSLIKLQFSQAQIPSGSLTITLMEHSHRSKRASISSITSS